MSFGILRNRLGRLPDGISGGQILIPTQKKPQTARVTEQCTKEMSGATKPRSIVIASGKAWHVGQAGVSLLDLIEDSKEWAREKARSESMSSRSDRDQKRQVTIPEPQSVEPEAGATASSSAPVQLNDIPDRILILATRLQRAIESRRPARTRLPRRKD